MLVVANAGSTLFARVTKAIEKLRVYHGLTKSQEKYVEEQIDSLRMMIKSIVKEFQGWVRSLKDEITLLKWIVL